MARGLLAYRAKEVKEAQALDALLLMARPMLELFAQAWQMKRELDAAVHCSAMPAVTMLFSVKPVRTP